MAYTLEFQRVHRYPPDASGIGLDVRLSIGHRDVSVLAKLDTGASYCIFQRQYCESLGLDLVSGLPDSVLFASGHRLMVFGHEVTLETLGVVFDTMVYFAEDEHFSRNVLGRRGWLDLVRIALIDYDNQLYLSPYDHSSIRG